MAHKNEHESSIEEQLEIVKTQYQTLLTEILRERLSQVGQEMPETIEPDQIPRLLEEITVNAEQTRLTGTDQKNEFLVVQGAAGSGKGTIGKELEEQGVNRLVRSTDRQKRPNEKDRVDYNFLTKDAFSKKFAAEEFIGTPAETYGERRGIEKKILQENLSKGSFYIEGSARTPRDLFATSELAEHKFLSAFLLTPSFDELITRLQKRTQEEQQDESANQGASSDEQLMKRIEGCVEHLNKTTAQVDGRSVTNIFVVNDKIDRATKIIRDLL